MKVCRGCVPVGCCPLHPSLSAFEEVFVRDAEMENTVRNIIVGATLLSMYHGTLILRWFC
jgi:hypothetical protein